MTHPLTADALRPYVEANPGLVKEALAELFAGDARSIDLDAIKVSASAVGLEVTELLVLSLTKNNVADQFLSFMRGHGAALLTPDELDELTQAFTSGEPADDTVDHERLATFAAKSRAFRCRISVGGQVMGSGALVSPRLVLTAAHVIAPVLNANDPAQAPKIDVLASDNQRYSARKAFALPHHPSEHTGAIPPVEHAETHVDVALLRLDHPLGRLYGHVDFPAEPVKWLGEALFFLVHFPNGLDTGLSIGSILHEGGRPIRLPHKAQSAGGSSGGPGFDRNFDFLGIHQGRLGNFRRIVPYDRFAKNAAFQRALQSDQPPRYLWSLDGSLNGHLIVGRETFFNGISAIVEGTVPNLRGLWIRRVDPATTVGLSFSCTLLEGFLRAHEAGHTLYRIPMDLSVVNLADHMALQTGLGFAPRAMAGVADGQTTDVAQSDDRMRQLVDKLDQRAASCGQITWVYIDNPPAGLTSDTQIQLEHFVQAAVKKSNLRVVIAGYETLGLVSSLTETVEDARRSRRPNILVDHIGLFSQQDVEATVQEMSLALGLGWVPEVVTHVVKLALKTLTPKFGTMFDPVHLKHVSDVVRAEARRMLDP